MGTPLLSSAVGFVSYFKRLLMEMWARGWQVCSEACGVPLSLQSALESRWHVVMCPFCGVLMKNGEEYVCIGK